MSSTTTTLQTGEAVVPSSSLTAPPMSMSSSKSSYCSEMWSNQTSRRGSDASSVSPPTPDLLSNISSDKFESTPALATTTSKTIGTAPAAVTHFEGNLTAALKQPPRPAVRHSDDPLLRTYPKPNAELDISEALAREPVKWTLGHWKKNARDVAESSSTPFTAASKKRFEDIKDELRRSQATLSAPKKPIN